MSTSSRQQAMAWLASRSMKLTKVAEQPISWAMSRWVRPPRRDILKPFCYCCQVVRNMALDHCRRQAVESSYRIYPDDGELPQVSGGSIPDHQLHGMQVIDAIDRILCGLPSRTRQVFELSRLGGLTQRDIAQEIGCSATLVNFMLRDATQAIACCRELVDIG